MEIDECQFNILFDVCGVEDEAGNEDLWSGELKPLLFAVLTEKTT